MGKADEHEHAWAEALQEIEASATVSRETCVWDQQDYEGGDCWETDCGECFSLNDGTPSDNRMKFCCYCGKALEERLFVEEAEEEEVQP